MRGALLRSLTLLVALSGPAGAVQVRRSEPPPKRPSLPREQDTNSAVAYYAYGQSHLATFPNLSAAAFYWASRLDPSWAAPLYGQYAALLLEVPPTTLTAYYTPRRGGRSNPVIQQLDSLAYLALMKNPFVDRTFDGVVLSTWLARATGNETTIRDLGQYDRRFTAWAAYTRGDYPMAIKTFGEVLRHDPDDPDLWAWQAQAFFAVHQYDSARVDIERALSLEHKAEAELPGVGWVSHAFAEYSVGFLFTLSQQPDSARAAYERALLDDVAFHPAHLQLGHALLAARDTAGALAEFGQATTLAPTDASYLYELGMLLIVSGQPDSGAAVLRQAVAVEPFYALPHYTLGLIYEQSGFAHEAAEHFTAFVQLAPRTLAPALTIARAHLATLQARP